MDTRSTLNTQVSNYNSTELDGKIKTNGVGAITGPVLNGVLKQLTALISDLVESNYNLLSDNTDELIEGIHQRFVKTVQSIAERDSILGDSQEGDLVLIQNNGVNNIQLDVLNNGTWETLFELGPDGIVLDNYFNKNDDTTDAIQEGSDKKFIYVVADIATRNSLNPSQGMIAIVKNNGNNEIEHFIYTANQWVSVFTINNATTKLNLFAKDSDDTDDINEGALKRFIYVVNDLASRNDLVTSGTGIQAGTHVLVKDGTNVNNYYELYVYTDQTGSFEWVKVWEVDDNDRFDIKVPDNQNDSSAAINKNVISNEVELADLSDVEAPGLISRDSTIRYNGSFSRWEDVVLTSSKDIEYDLRSVTGPVGELGSATTTDTVVTGTGTEFGNVVRVAVDDPVSSDIIFTFAGGAGDGDPYYNGTYVTLVLITDPTNNFSYLSQGSLNTQRYKVNVGRRDAISFTGEEFVLGAPVTTFQRVNNTWQVVGTHKISEHLDVSNNAPNDGEVLQYNTSSLLWEPANLLVQGDNTTITIADGSNELFDHSTGNSLVTTDINFTGKFVNIDPTSYVYQNGAGGTTLTFPTGEITDYSSINNDGSNFGGYVLSDFRTLRITLSTPTILADEVINGAAGTGTGLIFSPGQAKAFAFKLDEGTTERRAINAWLDPETQTLGQDSASLAVNLNQLNINASTLAYTTGNDHTVIVTMHNTSSQSIDITEMRLTITFSNLLK